jgi:hypothetical protein
LTLINRLLISGFMSMKSAMIIPPTFGGAFGGRFHRPLRGCLQDRSLDVFGAFVAAGIHVHGNERLGFIDHNVAAAGQTCR